MYHKPHVGFVDSHAESDGSHDDVDVLHQEVILCLGTGTRIETSMIGRGLDVVCPQNGGQLLHLLPRQAVDDTALAGVLFDKLDNILVDILRLRSHLIIEVRTVEGAFELRGVKDAEVFLDVGTYLISGRCRQSNDGRWANLIDNRTDTTVLRTKSWPHSEIQCASSMA